MKAVLYKPSNGTLIADAIGRTIREYPRHDMAAVSDPQPDQEWLLCVEGEKPPLAAGEKLSATTAKAGAHADYPHLNTWLTTYTAVSKSQAELDAAEASRIAGIKAKAFQVIIALFPEWKQRNMIAQAVESVKDGLPVPQDCLDAWAWAKAVRTHSDELEADAQLAENWPTYPLNE